MGIGGSAGSIEALEQFFSNLAPDTGMAFVIVQHLDPRHKDIMPEILQRITRARGRETGTAQPHLRDPAQQGHVADAR